MGNFSMNVTVLSCIVSPDMCPFICAIFRQNGGEMSMPRLDRLFHWLFFVFSPAGLAAKDNAAWIPAAGNTEIRQQGVWTESRFRYAEAGSLASSENGAALELNFEGTGISIRLGGHNVPAYGPPNLGELIVKVDDRDPVTIRPRGTARELVLAHSLVDGAHRLIVEHRSNGQDSGCRIEGFRTWSKPCGELQFTVNGEANAFLVDARVRLTDHSEKITYRNSLVRNWMTGQCCLAGLPPGKDYHLIIEAAGWKTQRLDGIEIEAGKPTTITPIHLVRSPSTVITRFRFPALNRPAIRKPGDTFRARFLGYDTEISQVRLIRRLASASISRTIRFEEDLTKAYYYDREIVAHLPDDMAPGLYDLEVSIDGGRRTGICRSPRSVHVVREFPKDPVLVTFGHLDTSAQYQAEYLERIATMANLIGADMVLNSNAVNPAYISGALSRLKTPHLVNFGNHQFFGHEQWYGDPVNRVDFGQDIAILNYGHPWHHGIDLADALFSQRPNATLKIINAFEQNAPLEFLDRHRVSLIHDAHGTGGRVMNLGVTPTRRVGKTNAISFRVIRFKDGRVEKCTYNGHETKPIPFARHEDPPLFVSYSGPNDGSDSSVTATITNRYLDPFPNGRVRFFLPQGRYKASGGRIESQVDSDDREKRLTEVTVRVDIPAESTVEVTLARR